MMSKIGQALIAALQEALDDAEGRIELRTTHPDILPLKKTIGTDNSHKNESSPIERIST